MHSPEGSFICSTRWDPRPKPHWLSEKQRTVQFLAALCPHWRVQGLLIQSLVTYLSSSVAPGGFLGL